MIFGIFIIFSKFSEIINPRNIYEIGSKILKSGFERVGDRNY